MLRHASATTTLDSYGAAIQESVRSASPGIGAQLDQTEEVAETDESDQLDEGDQLDEASELATRGRS